MNDTEWGCRKSVSLFLDWLTFTHNVSIHTKKNKPQLFTWHSLSDWCKLVLASSSSQLNHHHHHGTSSSPAEWAAVCSTCSDHLCTVFTADGSESYGKDFRGSFSTFSAKKIYLDFFLENAKQEIWQSSGSSVGDEEEEEEEIVVVEEDHRSSQHHNSSTVRQLHVSI